MHKFVLRSNYKHPFQTLFSSKKERIQNKLELTIHLTMSYYHSFTSSDEYRREELIRKIEHAVNGLTLEELEALHYDMITKNYINDEI